MLYAKLIERSLTESYKLIQSSVCFINAVSIKDGLLFFIQARTKYLQATIEYWVNIICFNGGFPK